MPVTLDAIKFNHDPTNASTNALNIRRNASTFVNVPEWRSGISVTPEDSPAAYAIKETRGQRLTIEARFRWAGSPAQETVQVRALDSQVNPPGEPGCAGLILSIIRAIIRALFGNVLGEVKARSISFGPGGLSAYEAFELVNTRIDKVSVGIRTTNWRWQYRVGDGSWTDFESSKHRIYILLEVPTAPWQQIPYVVGNTQLPWTEVLDKACTWATLATDRDSAADRITRAVYQLGNSVVTYDCPNGGASHYAYPNFDCTAFLERMAGSYGNGPYVNCTDCATFVSTFANAVGCDLWQSRMGWGFQLNPLLAIGSATWQTACNWGGFSYHEVAWEGACDAANRMNDACLQVDGDANPTAAPHTPLQPTNMLFGTPGSGDYRDRLSPGGNCDPQTGSRVRRSVY